MIASSLPPSTVAQEEVRDVGPSLKADIAQLEKLPGGPTPAQVDDLAKYLGGVDAAIGWIGDADAVVIHPGAAFEGGLVAQTTDATASANLVTAIKSLVSLGGSKAGISLSTETYDGHTITIVHVTASDARQGSGNRLHPDRPARDRGDR